MTIAKDAFDLPVTGASEEQTIGYDDYVVQFLSYGSELRHLFDIASTAPQSAMLNAHAAALHLAFEGAEGWAHAHPFLNAMAAAPSPVSPRETYFCEAVSRWAQQDFYGALNALDELTLRWPADLCAIKWGQYHAFNVGDQAALLRFAERARIVHENRPYTHGMIAFALEQNHHLEEAEEQGMLATRIALDDAWAHHAVAHVMETNGRAKDGSHWMSKCAHTWDAKGIFIRDHNWWHTALFNLTLGRYEDVFRIYDTYLWGAWPEFPQEQIGAVSMLWRLEMRGLDVGDRWNSVVEQITPRTEEQLLPFHDIHYLIALARAGADNGNFEAAETMLENIKAFAETRSGEAKIAWRDALVPAAEGCIAFARQDFTTAAHHMTKALPFLSKIGGSHAQRHLFVEAIQYAGLKAKSNNGRSNESIAFVN
ncbi:MAG: tetratricopeptide repeat protein [Pseudomonadota bacterium]